MWRPFEQCRENVEEASRAALRVAQRNRCNRHYDCDRADQVAREAGRLSADHCHDECCE